MYLTNVKRKTHIGSTHTYIYIYRVHSSTGEKAMGGKKPVKPLLNHASLLPHALRHSRVIKRWHAYLSSIWSLNFGGVQTRGVGYTVERGRAHFFMRVPHLTSSILRVNQTLVLRRKKSQQLNLRRNKKPKN